jgi:hypothetical protein
LTSSRRSSNWLCSIRRKTIRRWRFRYITSRSRPRAPT